MELTSAQRKHLKRLAHDLQPVVQIGREGVSTGVTAAIDTALIAHELIKVKFLDHRDEKQDLTQQLEVALGAISVGGIGHVVILFRQNEEREKQKIRLPRK